jgi:hypothetical protein
MRKNTALVGICLVMIAACSETLFLAQVATCEEKPGSKSEAEKEHFFRRMAEFDNGDFTLKGTVTDEAGNSLKGVIVGIEKGKIKIMDVEYTEERKTIDGQFQLSFKNYGIIRLNFELPGYYGEEIVFNFNEIKDFDEDLVMSDKPLPKRKIIKEDIRVVLRKEGILTDLIKGGAELEYQTNGVAKVYDFAKHVKNYGRPVVPAVVSNIFDISTLPLNCVYFLPETNSDGSLATNVLVLDRPPEAPFSQVKKIVPKSIRLVMHVKNPGSGFVASDVQRQGRRSELQMMTIAPETGYNKELILEREFFQKHLRASGQSHNTQYFYFKINDKYGKGSITSPAYKAAAQVKATAVVRFQLQPDGSRNLEARE